MEISFKSWSVRKKCEKWKYFKDHLLNHQLTKRLIELDKSKNLLVVKKLTNLKLHPLKWWRKYELAIDIDGRKNPNRIVFVSLDGENVCDDWKNDSKFETITQIEIIEIGDYH